VGTGRFSCGVRHAYAQDGLERHWRPRPGSPMPPPGNEESGDLSLDRKSSTVPGSAAA
jgi:hypothetical protein